MGCGDDGKSVDIVQSSLDFGKTDCGTTAIPRTLVVSNPSGSAFTFSTSLALGDASPYLVVPDSGVVLPSRQLELTVYSKPVPPTSAVTDNLYGDTLTLTTDEAGDSPHSIAITQTAHGAVLSFSVPAIDFATPSTIGAAAQTQALSIKNDGNATVAVELANNDSFALETTGPQMVMAGSSLATQLSYVPHSIGAITEHLSLSVTGTVCSGPPTLDATASSNLKGAAKQVALAVQRGRPNNSTSGTMCVQTTGGFVACTGDNTAGARGALAVSASSYNLVRTATGVLDNVVELVGGRAFFCARRVDETVWCWGDYAGLGRKGSASATFMHPTATQVADHTQSLAAAYSYTCSVSNGTTTCSGSNSGHSSPVENWVVGNSTSVAMTSAGGYAIQTDGTVLSFGENAVGERGNADPSESPPSAVTGLTGITQVVAGSNGGLNRNSRHGCALKNDGTAWCWGRNRHGQLGNGSTTNSNVPVQVMTDGATPLANVTALSAAGPFSCAIAGSVYCWGRNSEGELGSTTATPEFASLTNPEITNAVQIATLARTGCAVLATGGVRCWGVNYGGLSGPISIAGFEP